LFKDRRFHAHTARLIEGEAKASLTAWTQSMDANDAARSRVIALRTQVSTKSPSQQILDYIRDTAGGDQGVAAAHCMLQAQFIQAVDKALAARDANRNTKGDDNHVSRTGARRTK
nr:hypothetical protein [Tanacetum cinerariifolium]